MFVLSLQRLKTGVEPSAFGVWSKMRKWDQPHPETGEIWVSDAAKIRSTGYTTKFKERNGDDADPLTSPLDLDAVVLAGQGAANGRLWIADSSIDPHTVPSLRQVRRGRAPGAPSVETRPRVSSLLVDELRQKQVMYEQELEQQREQIRQQDELMRQQQEQMRQQQEQQQEFFRQQQEHAKMMSDWMISTVQRIAPGGDGAGAMGMLPPPLAPTFSWVWVCSQTSHSIHLIVVTKILV